MKNNPITPKELFNFGRRKYRQDNLYRSSIIPVDKWPTVQKGYDWQRMLELEIVRYTPSPRQLEIDIRASACYVRRNKITL